MFEVTLVGTGGMMPLKDRHLSSMICRFKTKNILFDCGEGTQISLQKIGWGFKSIDVICITHFHADHVSGLPGLLHAINHSGREEELIIAGPVGLKKIVESLLIIARGLSFPIKYLEIESEENSITIGELTIKSLLLEHRVPCLAYKIETHRQGKFDIELAKALNIPKQFYSELQKGNEIIHEEKRYTPNMVLGTPRKGFKIVFCTDTRPIEEIVQFAEYADLFICEGIYADDDKLEKAKEYKHMLFSEAAHLAKKANVKELWLTHYSPSLSNPEDFIENARDIFENSHTGFDGKSTVLKYEKT
ncbi:MAG: ribonuclease Z [Defluviitaleaceae bacterium]|nr:ribonuclease Z [Defluviitaleaceae bacterium]